MNQRVEPSLAPTVLTALAERYGTPLFVYDGDRMRRQYDGLRDRLHPALEIFYSLKANPNVSVSALLRSFGARAEVSSLLELLTATQAGMDPGDIVFLGPGKSRAELAACLDLGIYAIVCESFEELGVIDELAAATGRVAPVALRVNPNFTVKGAGLAMAGRPRQFGIDADQLLAAPGLAGRHASVRLMGIHAYLGTRILDEVVIAENIARVLDLAPQLADRLGFPLDLVDVGGGLGVAYFAGERDLDPAVLTGLLNPIIEAFATRHPGVRLVLELGRYLTAPAGTYVTEVRYVKTSMGERFAVTDGGTNHHLWAVGIGTVFKRNFPLVVLNRAGEPATGPWQVCGPLCTPNDTIARDVALPDLRAGDLLGVLCSGAYGSTASPGLFLGHGFAAEVLVDGGRHHLVRERDSPADLLRQQRRYDITPAGKSEGA
jgi:diaminopimelate decarboxylase